MLFPEDVMFGFALSDLAETLGSYPILAPEPLPCDRYIARSCLQKAIRRGEVQLAQRALANLYEHDPAGVWRHIVVICIEDVGVANVDLLAQIIVAKRDRRWRSQIGGDWHVLAGLVRLMSEGAHCQAACDLLLRIMNDPALDLDKAVAFEAEPSSLAETVGNRSEKIELRGIAAIAMGGCLADGQLNKDPCGLFDVMTEHGQFSSVVAICRSAWKISRNPMAMLLPLIWEAWMKDDRHHIADDMLPAEQMMGGVPGYALDQFTRTGNTISRAFLRECQELRDLFEVARIRPADFSSTLGDLIFLSEGGLVRSRCHWSLGEHLRLPYRQLPAVARLGSNLDLANRLVEAKACQIAKMRAQHFLPPQT
ncbi:MAG: hypothetical protein ABL931_05770 [Usitatibacteraceae bacterium]